MVWYSWTFPCILQFRFLDVISALLIDFCCPQLFFVHIKVSCAVENFKDLIAYNILFLESLMLRTISSPLAYTLILY
jgi:hypothetical protein